MRVTITLTNELPPTSPTCLQFYNIIFRRCAGTPASRGRAGSARGSGGRLGAPQGEGLHT